MNNTCKCGGRIVTLDWQWNTFGNLQTKTMLALNEPTVAHFQCNSCGKTYNQRKKTKK